MERLPLALLPPTVKLQWAFVCSEGISPLLIEMDDSFKSMATDLEKDTKDDPSMRPRNTTNFRQSQQTNTKHVEEKSFFDV